MAGSIMAGQTTNYLFDYPTSTDYVKDGATAIETLADDVDATLFTALGGAYPGLRLIKKQTIGTAVSSVTVTNAFSATYENYKIVVSGGTQSDDNANGFKLGASTTGYNYSLIFTSFSSSTVLGAVGSNSTIFPFVGGGDTNASFMNLELMQPFLSKFTRIASLSYNNSTNSGYYSGVHKVATSYTDFTIVPGSGTFTGGTIYVYGYGAS
jgi:hypothetical protein